MALPRVRLTSQLEAQHRASGADPNDLIADFQAWKAGGPDDNYTFGHDSRGIGSTCLFHVHMVPLTVAADLVAWDLAWKHYARRTSDRYLFYADGGTREGYLLIAIIDDPGAHAIWQTPSAVQDFEEVAEDFCVFGSVP